MWFSRQAIYLHLILLVVVPACLGLAWWQVNAALAGNILSYLYAFEWPFFAGYAVFIWWRLVHEVPERAGVGGTTPRVADRPAHPLLSAYEEDEELAEYNRYLAELTAHDNARRKEQAERRGRRQHA